MRQTHRACLWVLTAAAVLAAAGPLAASGKIEFGFHYGSWSVNILRGAIETVFGDEAKKGFLEKIRENTPGFEQTVYDQKVSFDSSGSNFGFELRWYPGGSDGSFSLGVAIEKTSIKVGLPEVSLTMEGMDTVTRQTGALSAKASGDMLIEPLSFHLGFRWDLWPKTKVHPYISFGFGIAGAAAYDTGHVSYTYAADFTMPNKPAEHYADSQSKTLRQLEKDDAIDDNGNPKQDPFKLPGVFPFVQFNLGLKFRVTESIHLLVDYGILDGFVLRGGLAVRI
jgi:hypothetical protein